MQNERPVDPQEFATYLERLSVARNHPMSGELTMIFMECLSRVVSELPFDEDSPESPPLWFLERLEAWLEYIYGQLENDTSTVDQARCLVRNLRTTVDWLQSRPSG